MGLHKTTIKIDRLASLAWHGDALVDWLGGCRYTLDGSAEPFGVGDTYRLDSAIGLEDHAVLYEVLGTKGLLVRDNGIRPRPGVVPLGIDVLRELDRSYYHANDYAFPIALLRVPDGRLAVAHCPRGYNILDIELPGGERLTARPDEPCIDIFHSRLEASLDGRWLVSNGWVWQPYNTVAVYDVELALRDPSHLSTEGVHLDLPDDWDWEIAGSVIFEGQLVIAAAEANALALVPLEPGPRPKTVRMQESPGTRFMALDDRNILAIDGHPRVIDIQTGRVVERHEDVSTGPGIHQPSVTMSTWEPPWIALDRIGRRVAVGSVGSVNQVIILSWRD